MEDGVRGLAETFARSIQPDRDAIKAAEEALKALSAQPGYAIAVLKVIAGGDALGADVRLAAGVNFKNLVKYRWVRSPPARRGERRARGPRVRAATSAAPPRCPRARAQVPTELAQESGTQAIPDAEKAQIKGLLPGLMLSTPPLIRAQLSEALSIISGHDFPAAWPQLLPELVERLGGAGEDLAVVCGVAATANSIFKRYRNQFSSNALVAELAVTQARRRRGGRAAAARPSCDACTRAADPAPCPRRAAQDAFAPVALATMQRLAGMLPGVAASGDLPRLRQLLGGARLLTRIFYSLNSPGLTPLMESQLDDWMAAFHTFLTFSHPGLDAEDAAGDPDREGASAGVKAAVCGVVDLFMALNEEECAKYLQTFVTDVWHLLVAVSPRAGDDRLAMSAISFLTTVARSVHAKLFADPGVLKQICESIVLPNLRVRSEDEEVFEVNPVEYIRRDIEGSDSDTRRRAAADLVRALTTAFEADVTALFTGYVAALLAEHAADRSGCGWRSKDAAVFLVMAVTVKGKTGERGATTTNALVNIGDFFAQQVLPELQDPDVNAVPILKADALKFVTTFRSHLPAATLLALLGPCTALLRSEAVVVHSYAAHAIERFLALREGGRPKLAVSDVLPVAQPLLSGLFGGFGHPDSGENEYLMRAVVRLITFLGPQMAPVAPMCLKALADMLVEVCKNPRSPGFNHYLFEAVAGLIRAGAAADPGALASYEATLFPAFDIVLSNDVQEFHPYVFQILAQLIELSNPPLAPVRSAQHTARSARPARVPPLTLTRALRAAAAAAPQAYMAIFPPLLTPVFWERPGNVPALTRLLAAYLAKAGQQVAEGHLTAVLGVWQKLIASRAHDCYGFALLGAILDSLPPSAYTQYLPTVWQLLFTRLQGSKTPRFTRGFTLLLARAVCKLGVDGVSRSMDAVQPGILAMILGQVWVPSLAGVEGAEEGKLVAVAATKLLTESAELYAQQPLWQALRGALDAKLKGTDAGGEQEDAGDDGLDELGGGYSAAYARLANASVPERPVLTEIADPKQFAESRLASFMTRMGATG
ncbi:hypothetical protein HT031_000009 [Scenedesmus sp. PABB004]|nr:hypothetical protein HT031_000009 [Scenedesmus sp. PABB004]